MKLIAVEGPNGAGKSSVARHLVREFGGETLRYSESFMRLRSESDLDRKASPIERLTLYLAAIQELSDRCMAAAGGLVVVDRYFASPLALLEVDGSLDAGVIDDVALPVLQRIALPTLTLLLTADRLTLCSRLAPQQEIRRSMSFELTLKSETFAEELTGAIRRRVQSHGDVCEIDTSLLSVGQVSATAYDVVRTHLNIRGN